jgi:hypothetical protein
MQELTFEKRVKEIQWKKKRKKHNDRNEVEEFNKE